jgi:multiple sugar transport system substrate-binding protein
VHTAWPRRLALAFAIAAAVACGARGREPSTTLRVVNWAPELELALEQSIADRFAARHPGVKVIVESVVANYGEKLVTTIASGSPPDVFLLDVPDIPAFVERGLALDLAPYVPRVAYDRSAIFPQVMAVFERGARLYAFPKDFTPMVMYCNRGVFTRAGVGLPPDEGWTWSRFLDTARRLTRDDTGDGQPEVYAFGFPRNLYEWIAFVWSAGGDILDPGGSRTRGYLDSPATVDTFRFLTSMATDWHVTPPIQYTSAGDTARTNRFVSGRQAMMMSGHWVLPLLLKHAARGGLDLAIAPIPHREGHASTSVIYVSGWAVPVNVRHKRLAVELAAFLGGKEAQEARAASRLGIPSLTAVAEAFAARDATGIERAFLREARRARMPWGAVVTDFHEIERMSLDIMDRHLLRGDDLATAAAEVASAIDATIAR